MLSRTTVKYLGPTYWQLPYVVHPCINQTPRKYHIILRTINGAWVHSGTHVTLSWSHKHIFLTSYQNDFMTTVDLKRSDGHKNSSITTAWMVYMVGPTSSMAPLHFSTYYSIRNYWHRSRYSSGPTDRCPIFVKAWTYLSCIFSWRQHVGCRSWKIWWHRNMHSATWQEHLIETHGIQSLVTVKYIIRWNLLLMRGPHYYVSRFCIVAIINFLHLFKATIRQP